MIGILIQLALSWLLLWFFEKKNLSVLGFKPTKDRLINFIVGLLAAAICYAMYCLITTYLTDNHWSIQNGFTIMNFLSSTWWVVNSVLFEEFIFRGALLFILIQKIGIRKACILSSVAFGIYHWFSFGVFGNPIPMIYVFLSTGFWGYMYAMAFAKTKSLYLPIGLHLGWNLFNIVVFSQGPLGKQFLINDNNGQLVSGLPSLALYLFQVLALPAVVYFYLRLIDKTRLKESSAK